MWELVGERQTLVGKYSDLIEKRFFAEFPFFKNGTKFLHEDQTKITYKVSLSLDSGLSMCALLLCFLVRKFHQVYSISTR